MASIALKLTTILFLCQQLIYSTEGRLFPGRCPNLLTASKFELSQIQGQWLEVESYGDSVEATLTKCNAVSFNQTSDDVVSVDYSRAVVPEGILHNKGYAQQISGGKLLMTLQLPVLGLQTFPYSILDVNTDKYMVAWSCSEIIFFNVQKVWVLSRSDTLDSDSAKNINDLLQRNGFTESLFTKINQDKCVR